MGEAANNAGNLVQTGGSVVVNDGTDAEGPLRIGHYPTETSTYDLLGGTLSVPSGRVSIGIDGTGILNVNGGTATVARIEVNGRNNTGDGRLNLLAGRLRVAAGGIISEGIPYSVNYGAATLEATASFTSTVNATLNGGTVFHTASHTMTHSGALGGTGGFRKTGTGVLVLSGSNAYAGPVIVERGELRQTGAHTGGGSWTVKTDGVLAGGGSTSASVEIEPGAAISPGVGAVGTLTVSGALTLRGRYALDVSAATSDRIAGVSSLTMGPGSVLDITGTLTAPSYIIANYTSRTGAMEDTTEATVQGYQVVYDDLNGQMRLEEIPFVANPSADGSSVVIAWPARAGEIYSLQYRTNLLNGTWQYVTGLTNLLSSGGTMSVTNLITGDNRGYYRVVNEP
jgi:autotransporter-associated beta strand protein